MSLLLPQQAMRRARLVILIETRIAVGDDGDTVAALLRNILQRPIDKGGSVGTDMG